MLGGWIGHVQLVLDAPQEGIVHKVFRLQVGGQHQEKLEGYLEFLARLEGQVIYSLLQRYDPPVEERLGAHLLTSKVVNEEQPAVGLQLEWGLVETRVLVIYQVERGHG